MSNVLVDTTSKTINGKDGTADFTIDDGVNLISYKCILDEFSVRELTEMTTSDTFCIEGLADQDPGRSQLHFDMNGLGKKMGVASGPLIPAPQNVTIKATVSTGCYLSFAANFTEAFVTRLVNRNTRVGARGLSKGSYIIIWVKS